MIKNYWDAEWKSRIKSNGLVQMNMHKLDQIVNELNKRLLYGPMKKLDIGCGCGVHAATLCQFNPWWKERWMGLDRSSVAINKAKSFGLTAIKKDIRDFETDERFELFLLLDTLEHLEDRIAVAEKIKQLAVDGRYYIFGNVPLYTSNITHAANVEWPIQPSDVVEFLMAAGCKKHAWHHIYGSAGWPYMMFESSNHALSVEPDENFIALSAMG